MKEYDSSVLISYLASESESDDVQINIQTMRTIGHMIEDEHPSIMFDMDKYSIESFRIKSRGSVVVTRHELKFSRVSEPVKIILQRSKPSDRMSEIIKKVLERRK